MLIGAQYFSRLDLAKAYYHVTLTADWRMYPMWAYFNMLTAHGTEELGSSFSKICPKCPYGEFRLHCLYWWHPCVSSSADSVLFKVLERLPKHNFRLNLTKCDFKDYPANVIPSRCFTIDPEQLQGICDMLAPTTPKQLQSFWIWLITAKTSSGRRQRSQTPTTPVTQRRAMVVETWSRYCNKEYPY